MRTVFLGHNFTNGNDYRLCMEHRVCYYGLKFFKMHPLLKPYNLFYSNGVAILRGFHDILQYEACRGE